MLFYVKAPRVIKVYLLFDRIWERVTTVLAKSYASHLVRHIGVFLDSEARDFATDSSNAGMGYEISTRRDKFQRSEHVLIHSFEKMKPTNVFFPHFMEISIKGTCNSVFYCNCTDILHFSVSGEFQFHVRLA